MRCLSPTNSHYADYGARGVSVCERWIASFADFMSDMGDRPSPKHSIDRIDNNGDYEPDNCRWATKKEQSRNTRANLMIRLGNATKPLIEWCEIFDLSYETIRQRLENGWRPVRAFMSPAKPLA